MLWANLPQQTKLSLGALLLANMSAVIGVLWFGWDVKLLILAYWMESAIVGVFALVKMGLASRIEEDKQRPTWLRIGFKFFSIPFFLVHYGFFMTGHIFIIYDFLLKTSLSPAQILADLGQISYVFPLALFVSHAVSFVTNYLGRKEFKRTTVKDAMGAPYERILIMHIALLAGAFVATATGIAVSTVAAIVFIALKTALDSTAHLKEHAKS